MWWWCKTIVGANGHKNIVLYCKQDGKGCSGVGKICHIVYVQSKEKCKMLKQCKCRNGHVDHCLLFMPNLMHMKMV